MINDKGKFKHQYLYLVIITTLLGYIPISHAEYSPSKNINKTIGNYDEYDVLSKELQNLKINTPGESIFGERTPNEAIHLQYNGDDTVDFSGKQLNIKNIEITATPATDTTWGGRSGISSLSNNILAENIQINSTDGSYSGIFNSNNENFDNHRDQLSTSNFILKNSEFNLHGDKSNGIYTSKTSINKDSFAHVEVDDSIINIPD